jgi:uncharacterized membrane protein YqjE
MAEPVNDKLPDTGDPTIGRLVTDASRDISTLISKQIELTKSELRLSVKAGGAGIAFFAVAAFLAMMALIMLSVAIAYLIHWNGRGLDLHWAYLCVFAFYLVLAGILGLIGLRKVKKVRAPERSISQAKETAAVLKR